MSDLISGFSEPILVVSYKLIYKVVVSYKAILYI